MNSAIILCAGRGERMRPLTDTTPKALLPVKGKPLVVHHLEKLSSIGIKNIVINISHLADQIKKTLGDGSSWGVKIQYSEEPTPLETGGGIFQALPLLGNKPFLAISGDIYTNYPFENLLTFPEDGAYLAHLILVPNPSYHPNGDFSITKNNFLSNQPEYTYASMGVLHPTLFSHCKPGKFRLAPLLREAIDRQKATGELYQGLWHNVGTVKEWEILNKL